jgi:MFS family permease
MGVSESLFMPSAIALTANAHAPASRSRAIAALSTAQIAGTVGGGWFGGWMAQQGRWREAFFVLGAVGLLYALPYALFLRGAGEQTEVETKKSGSSLAVAELVKAPTFLLLCVVFPVFVFGLWLLYGWLPNFLHEKFALDLADAAFNATAFLQGATLFGMVSGGCSRTGSIIAPRPRACGCSPRACCSARRACMRLVPATARRHSPCCDRIRPVQRLLHGEHFPGGVRGGACGHARLGRWRAEPLRRNRVRLRPLFGGVWKKTVGIERLLSNTALLYLMGALLLIAGITLLFQRDYQRIHSGHRPTS